MCFVWIPEQTAIISLYNINWLVCITETESVYCAVRTEVLNTIPVNRLRRLVAALSELRPGFHSSSLRVIDNLWCTKWHWDILSPRTSIFPCQYHSTSAPHSSSPTCWTCQNKWAKPGNLQQSDGISEIEDRWIENYFHFFFRSLRNVNLVAFWTLNTVHVTSHTLTAHAFISWNQTLTVYYKVKLINQYVIKIYDKVQVKLQEW